MNNKSRIIILAVLAAALTAGYIFWDLGPNWDYALPRRVIKIIAIIVVGCAIAFSTVIFQTVTNNKILTPSILGLDSMYMLIQTGVIFIFGSTHIMIMNKNLNFLITLAAMLIFASLLFKFMFKKNRNIYFLLLIGIIFGTLFGSMSSFMQVLIDPNEFQIIQNKMFASFNNVNTDLLTLAIILMIAAMIYFMRFLKYLDVMSLGRDQAINLGVDYDFVTKRVLIVVTVLISISTALIGPITFLGLLVANVAYQFIKSYQHKHILPGAMLISVIALVGGQFIVERIFTFSTTLSVIINFVGGVYFIYLLLKENKSW
ncbi:iron chelate uptake ABC transporter family permease subunit [Peribacillus castrilensis]|jgi:iron complex transport system permease protein|uniref:Iron chelate uptake ABC transporter family permease subunit n=2 Tax=Peribacillus frigoritolerans TaxID=450367 RepID=A0AAJ1VDY6_9BACI|nr:MULTISPECIES: iron chelate uptake ABC transporter family permease subunit [Bacillaceae]MBL3642356.1 iron chelate uptake ABC transporter family permease subunit [Bacillus sp. RHFB]MCD1161535.1 iron chelate uptake ABC transporter family permease subunit [Peribacillus castrilensis]MCP1095735.1 iron chelate uptake ABC transporter family permease subunit [Bacillaceae bacterium OS4b]QYF83472.1 iron chelate uptake ABC transporter family permease subunit [Brevibacterium sp. PAMC21349]MBD8586486.1 i